mgnify:CR=1 FL=1
MTTSPNSAAATRIVDAGSWLSPPSRTTAPVIGGGQLYVMDTAGVVHAFDAQTGTERWTAGFQIKGDGANSVYGGGASYDNGRVYITTGMGEVAALDAKNGAVLWKV